MARLAHQAELSAWCESLTEKRPFSFRLQSYFDLCASSSENARRSVGAAGAVGAVGAMDSSLRSFVVRTG